MTQIAPNRFPEARKNGVALMRAIREAEAEDHRAVNDDDRAAPGCAVFALLCVVGAALTVGLVWAVAYAIIDNLAMVGL